MIPDLTLVLETGYFCKQLIEDHDTLFTFLEVNKEVYKKNVNVQALYLSNSICNRF